MWQVIVMDYICDVIAPCLLHIFHLISIPAFKCEIRRLWYLVIVKLSKLNIK